MSAEATDGWMVEYAIRRDDGREVQVVAECAAQVGAAEAVADETVRRFLADRGRAEALERAEDALEHENRLKVACYDASTGLTFERDSPKGGG